MKHHLAMPAILSLMSGAASAGGLDRTGQPMEIIFEEGNYIEFSVGHANPTVSGQDVVTAGVPFEATTGNVSQNFNQIAAALKYDISEQLSFALIYDQPWGSDISYAPASGNPAVDGSNLLGGTQAFASSDSITGILRYKLNDTFSLHGGLRYQQTSGNITLGGLAYGPLNGYRVNLDRDSAVGWIAGGAYEIPDIALRLAVTYQSAIEHKFATQDTFGGPDTLTRTKTPQSVNIDFQTGVAADTLLFVSARWAEHSQTNLIPTNIGVDLIEISDTTTYNIGVARQLNRSLAGSISLGYEAEKANNMVSPLNPTNGFTSISLGLQYKADRYKISGGVRYTKFGDAFAMTGPPNTARASFKNNDAVSFGLKMGYYF